jgi:hypothetical protein
MSQLKAEPEYFGLEDGAEASPWLEEVDLITCSQGNAINIA